MDKLIENKGMKKNIIFSIRNPQYPWYIPKSFENLKKI